MLMDDSLGRFLSSTDSFLLRGRKTSNSWIKPNISLNSQDLTLQKNLPQIIPDLRIESMCWMILLVFVEFDFVVRTV